MVFPDKYTWDIRLAVWIALRSDPGPQRASCLPSPGTPGEGFGAGWGPSVIVIHRTAPRHGAPARRPGTAPRHGHGRARTPFRALHPRMRHAETKDSTTHRRDEASDAPAACVQR